MTRRQENKKISICISIGLLLAMVIAKFLFFPGISVESANLIRVVDGDTIVCRLQNGELLTVRLIGIDAPESVHSDESKNTPEGVLASDFMKTQLTEFQTIWLEYDKSKEDTYGRTLAYVWLVPKPKIANYETDMLNAVIVLNGHAEAKDYPPNTKYSDLLNAAYEKYYLDM